MGDSAKDLVEQVLLWTGWIVLVCAGIVAFMLLVEGGVLGGAGGVALLWTVDSLLKTLKKQLAGPGGGRTSPGPRLGQAPTFQPEGNPGRACSVAQPVMMSWGSAKILAKAEGVFDGRCDEDT
jgi:hypothetical protein